MTVVLQVRLLGQFRLTVDGQPVDRPTTARLQSLLAYLLLHADAPQSRATLSFTFWPDASEANARNNLRQLLHQLRQSLPDPDRYLRADANSVQWDGRLLLQPRRRLLRQGRRRGGGGGPGRRRGRRLAAASSGRCDLPGAAAPELLRRLDRTGARPSRAALQGCRGRARGPARAAARVRERHRPRPALAEHDPLDERGAPLADAAAGAGRRSARRALQAYRQCADAPAARAGRGARAETVRVYERIRDAELGARASPKDARRRPRPRRSWAGRPSGRGCGRPGSGRVRGRAGFALVTGDAGIGKSRLAEELLTWAQRQGVATARTRSYAAEGRLSLAPVSEWLRSDALAPHLARLEDVWRVEVARILPELLAARPDLPRPAPMTEFGDRLRFFEGLARAMLAAPQPLLLLIDDLQWCDRETLEWLHFLSRFDPAGAPARPRDRALGGARAAHPLPALAPAPAQRVAARRDRARAARRRGDGGAGRPGREPGLRRRRGHPALPGDRGQSALHRGDGAGRERRRRRRASRSRESPGFRPARTR